MSNCSRCGGTRKVTCPNCGGPGWTTNYPLTLAQAYPIYRGACRVCGGGPTDIQYGRGWIPCPHCSSTASSYNNNDNDNDYDNNNNDDDEDYYNPWDDVDPYRAAERWAEEYEDDTEYDKKHILSWDEEGKKQAIEQGFRSTGIEVGELILYVRKK